MMATINSDHSPENLIPFNRPVNREILLKKAEAELKETDETRENGLIQMRELIEEHNLRCITTDEFLLRFLRVRKFDVTRSFETLQNYCQERIAVHHLISALSPETMEACLRHKIVGILPYRDYEGRLIIFVREGKWNKSICTDEEAVMCAFVLICHLVEDESVQINGIHVLSDESCFCFNSSLHALNHLRIRRHFLFKCAPMRWNRIDAMNNPWQFDVVLAVVKKLLPAKIGNRIFLHGKRRDELFEHIPECLLTPESENTDDLFINPELVPIMISYLQRMKEEQQYFLSERSEHTEQVEHSEHTEDNEDIEHLQHTECIAY